MDPLNAFVSPEYPVLYTLSREGDSSGGTSGGEARLALALLVRGIPSFLATIPVEDQEIQEILTSLRSGGVRVAAIGITVRANDIPGVPPREPWQGVAEEGGESLSAAFLSLLCRDGRRIGLARIVSRDEGATPEQVARFVLRQIADGVQVPNLASTP